MQSSGHCKIWTLAEDQNEYERLLSGENKHSLSVEQINSALRQESLSKLQLSITVIHDPSDIRKPHSEKLGHLDKVRAANPQAVLTHVLDREYDDQACFELIDKQLKDKFVIRLKLNRVSTEQAWDEERQKEVSLKLKAKQLNHTFKQYYDKFSWGGGESIRVSQLTLVMTLFISLELSMA